MFRFLFVKQFLLIFIPTIYQFSSQYNLEANEGYLKLSLDYPAIEKFPKHVRNYR